MRVDIFLREGQPGQSRLYREAVTATNAKNIIAALERDGEMVIVCRHTRRGVGKFVYETARDNMELYSLG